LSRSYEYDWAAVPGNIAKARSVAVCNVQAFRIGNGFLEVSLYLEKAYVMPVDLPARGFFLKRTHAIARFIQWQ
jgi:hypothetical protein